MIQTAKSALLVIGDQVWLIPQNNLPHALDRFDRGTNVVGRFAGTDLGRASARELVELNGGTISVESEEGKGGTFVVRPPLTRQRKPRVCHVSTAGGAAISCRTQFIKVQVPRPR